MPSVTKPEGFTGQLWRVGNVIRTLQPNGEGVSLKSFLPFGSHEKALEVHDVWKHLGYKGSPSSPASFFHQVCYLPKIPYSAQVIFLDHLHGAWQEVISADREASEKRRLSVGARKLQTYTDPHYYYDLKSAYFWAASIEEGYPTRVYPMTVNDERYLCLCDLEKCKGIKLPSPLRKPIFVADNYDVELYGIPKKAIKIGVGLYDYRYLDVEFERVFGQGLPVDIQKSITQSFWGRWHSARRTVREKWVNGVLESTTELKNNKLNFIWGLLTLHRVIRKLWQSGEKKLVITDAILTSEKMEVPQNPVPGDWVLKEYAPEGVVVVGAGIWTPIRDGKIPDNFADFLKHSGYARAVNE